MDVSHAVNSHENEYLPDHDGLDVFHSESA